MKFDGNSADSESGIKPVYWSVLAVSLLALVGYLSWVFLLGGPPSPTDLAVRALSAGDLKERKQAMAELSASNDRQVLPALRQVAKESKDPEVLSSALYRLMVMRDRESLTDCFAGLNNPSKEVRAAAHEALLLYYGGFLPEKLKYSPNDAADKRAKVVAKLEMIHNQPAPPMQ